MDASTDGGIQTPPTSPKFRAFSQLPGPNGSRVIRRRSSIPRLGAGLEALVMQVRISKKSEGIRAGDHGSAVDVPEFTSDEILSTSSITSTKTMPVPGNPEQNNLKLIDVGNKTEPRTFSPRGMVAATQSSMNSGVENNLVPSSFSSSSPYSSPTSSIAESGFDPSNISLDGIQLSSPNSTPPPSNERDHGKNGPFQASSRLASPSQPIKDRVSSYQQYTPHLADKLTDIAPFSPMKIGDNRYLPAIHSTVAAVPHDQLGTMVPIKLSPLLGLTSAQVKDLFEAIQSGRDSIPVGELNNQNGDWPAVAPQRPHVEQSNQDHTAVPPNPHSSNVVPIIFPTDGCHVPFVASSPYPKPFPQEFAGPFPTQRPVQRFKNLSKIDKLSSLEFKLTRHVYEDVKRAENSPAGVHVFVDMSNIWIGFSNAVKMALGMPLKQYLKTPFSFENLARILERGRNIQKRVLAGSLSFPASRRQNWPPHLREAEDLKYEMNIFDRVQVEKKPPKFKRKNRTSNHRSMLYNPNDITSTDESTEGGTVAKIVRKNGEQGVGKSIKARIVTVQVALWLQETHDSSKLYLGPPI